MEFIDHTGHIFTITSYSTNPIGYEWNEGKYIFWFNTEYGYKLSVNDYYFMPVRVLVPIDSREDEVKVSIELAEKSSFHLIGSKQIQQLLMKNSSIVETINIEESDFVQSLSTDDVLVINTLKDERYKCIYVPYYVYYSDNGTEMKYTGEYLEKRGNTYYGKIYFGPIVNEVELHIKYSEQPVFDDEKLDSEEVTAEWFNDITISDDGASVIFNRAKTQTSIPMYVYKQMYDAFILDSSSLNGEDQLKNTFTLIYCTTADGDVYVANIVYQRYAMIPFYAVVNAEEEGVWETNILVHTMNAELEDYCPITVGAEVYDECEALIINGRNMGVSLPKQILQAVYNNPFYVEHPDERMYANKIKEYLMNFMQIKGQQGNLRSAINSLKWFGWGDYVTINKLWKTDNDLQCQYVRDSFDIINDTIYSFETFRNATVISLSLKVNGELNETYQEFANEFWGEGKPEMEDYFSKMIIKHYDEEDIDFYRGYFDYTFDELGLKLCALKYYYDKYFLPIHLNTESVSMEHQCFTNDIKFITRPHTMITEKPIYTNGSKSVSHKFDVVFPEKDFQYLMDQTHYIDTNYCEFDDSYKRGTVYGENIYYINDTVVNIPIHFEQEDEEMYYNCKLILTKDDMIVHECTFQFTQKMSDHETYFKNFVIHPKTLNTVITGEQDAKYDANFWLDSEYTIYLCVNNVWFTYHFTMKLPELNIRLGRLEYKYYLDTYAEYAYKYGTPNLFKQLNGFGLSNGKPYIQFNSFMFQPDLVTVNNTDFISEVCKYAKANNVNYVDGSLVNPGSFYYYIEYNNVRYVFADPTGTVLKTIKGTNIYLIVNTDDIKITRIENGNYNLRVKSENLEVTGLPLHTTLFNTIDSYIKQYYTISNNYVDNKYLNRCHLIDLYDDNGKMIEYTYEGEQEIEAVDMNGDTFTFGDNSSKATVELYKQFFDKNGDSFMDHRIEYNDKFYTPCIINGMEFDFYLMHDAKNWYGMLISRNTIASYSNEAVAFKPETKYNVLTISVDEEGNHTYTLSYDSKQKSEYFLTVVNMIYETTYHLKYNRSDSKVLINRLQYVDSKGVNHFDTGDMIACTLVNNDKLPFKIGLGSKWDFIPMSIDMGATPTVTSPNEMAIISIGDENSKYEKGYYTVSCNYSLDDFSQHSYTKIAKLRVNK